MLAKYDPMLPLVLACDASDKGIGACIFQISTDGKEQVIEYASRTLTKAEKNYSQIEKEGLSIIFGTQKFRYYLLGRKFTLRTDHRPLVTIFDATKLTSPTKTSSRLVRWALQLSQYSYDIEYRQSAGHGNADALSRLPLRQEAEFDEFSKHEEETERYVTHIEQQFLRNGPIYYDQLQRYTSQDPILQKVITYVQQGWPKKFKDVDLKPYAACKQQFTINDGCLLKHADEIRIVVPSTIRPHLLHQLHRAHVGVDRMKQLARRYIWWPRINRDIESMVQHCDACALHRNNPPTAPLHPWEFPEKPWHRLHIDFAGPFKNWMWFVVVDAHSKWPEVVKLPVGSTTTRQVMSVLSQMFARFGIPKQLVSDNGPQFTAKEFQDFCKHQGILHTLTPPYHPQSNGQAERFIQSFKKAVRKGLEEPRITLDEVVDRFLAVYRNTAHQTTGESPAMLLLGRNLRCSLDMLRPDSPTSISIKLRETVRVSQKKQKMTHDRKSQNHRSFNVGDCVLVRQPASHNKDSWRPAVVIKVLGDLYYMVKFDGSATLRKVHVDQLQGRLRKSRTTDKSEDNSRGRDGQHGLTGGSASSDTSDNENENSSGEEQQIPIPIRRSRRTNKGRAPERYGDWV